jgi:hypothetical protein
VNRIVSPASALTPFCLHQAVSLIWCKELSTESGILINQAKALQNVTAAVQKHKYHI